MQKLDRMGWSAGLVFRSYGLKIGIRTNDGELLEQICAELPPNIYPSKARYVDRLYSLRLGKNIAHDRVFVHAGVIGWRGSALVLPGPTFAGKSTLVAELVRAGGIYFSDEFAVFDKDGCVHPFPRPIKLRTGDGTIEVLPRDLGGAEGRGSLQVGLVLSCRYRQGARTRLRRQSAGRGVLDLLENAVSARRTPGAVLRVLHNAVLSATSVTGIRGDAAESAPQILRLMEHL
ncbi:MAG: hypothetical protein LC772_09215 [Chloroflexi bacterium]|nr:hypothetical protein [Chloroflexota bacterium]